jgi:hypothetical protein
VSVIRINYGNNEKPVALVPAPGAMSPGDLSPGGHRATLQIANGNVITLSDSAHQSIEKGVTNANGQLIYETAGVPEDKGLHLLSTPAGGEYMVTLPDSSKVWLNALSSLRYPASFNEKQRLVQLEGEAYFEVKHQQDKPFVVQLHDKTEITVLGTSFNVNAYRDEGVSKTTLLTGKVQVVSKNKKNQLTILPGEQAIVAVDGRIKKVQLPDPTHETAWQRGYFEFKDTEIEIVMRTIARWYNAEIIYETKPEVHLNASVRRDVPASELLKWFSHTKSVHFEITHNKIIVKP